MVDFNYQIRIKRDNPWWLTKAIAEPIQRLTARPFLEDLFNLFQSNNDRPMLVAGPVGAGKSVLLQQLAQRLLKAGVVPRRLIHLSLDVPGWGGRELSGLVDHALTAAGSAGDGGHVLVLDGVHYLPHWEDQLLDLAKSHPDFRIVATSDIAPLGGLAPAGADAADDGRPFTGFILPPVTFAEFVTFRNLRGGIFDSYGKLKDVEALNSAFMDYLNWGGFVEATLGAGAKTDITTRVMAHIHRDMSNLYGVNDSGELAELYALFALHSGAEYSIEGLASQFGIAKNTLRKYMDYLEAAFLIRRLWRLDGEGKPFRRQTRFQVYLTNPAHRAALYGPVVPTDKVAGQMAMTAVLGQFMHTGTLANLYYAKWKAGRREASVAMVELSPDDNAVHSCMELDWSDRAAALPQKVLGDMTAFIDATNPAETSKVLTRSIPGKRFVGEREISFIPVALWCWGIGKVVLDRHGA